MKLELKRIETIERLSEETQCYAAVAYVDDKPFLHVSNAGHGGPDEERVHEKSPWQGAAVDTLMSDIQNQLAGSRAPEIFHGMTITFDFQLWCSEQVDNHLSRKQALSILRKISTLTAAGKIMPYAAKYKPTPANLKNVSGRLSVGEILLNTLPREDAIELIQDALYPPKGDGMSGLHSHVFCVAFSVESKCADASDVTLTMLRAAVNKRAAEVTEAEAREAFENLDDTQPVPEPAGFEGVKV